VKGSLEGVVPMLGLLLMTMVLAMQSLPISTALASVLGESSVDISNSAEAKSTSEHLLNYYIPDSATYSANNAAYELGRDNAGISWNRIPDDSDIISERIFETWESESNSKFDDRIENLNSECSLQREVQLSLYPDNQESSFDINTTNLNLSVGSENSDNLMIVRCSELNNIAYRKKDYGKDNIVGNRYGALGDYAARFYVESESQYNDYNPEVYTGSDSECPGSGSYSQAEREALSSLKSDTPDFSSIASQVQTPPNASVGGDVKENYRSNSERESTSCTVCTGSGEDRSCSSRSGSRVTVELTPTSSELDMRIETNEELILNGAYRNLEIRVDEYSHSH